MANTNWLLNDFVQEQAVRAVDGVLAEFRDSLILSAQINLGGQVPLESPIECVFLVWWHSLEAIHRIDSDFSDVQLWTQVEVTAGKNAYRLDFELRFCWSEEERAKAVHAGITLPRCAVELDGHDFHERTKQQVAKRNERDRELQTSGWTVLHYSGSELVRTPRECVMDAYHKAMGLFWPVRHRLADLRVDANA